MKKYLNRLRTRQSIVFLCIGFAVCILIGIAMCYNPLPIANGVGIAQPNIVKRVTLGIVGGCILAVGLTFCEASFSWSQRVVDGWKSWKRIILRRNAELLLSIVLAAPISFVWNKMVWSWLLLMFSAVGIFAIVVLVDYIIKKDIAIEKVVALYIILIGLSIIWLFPVLGYGWDRPSHYIWAVQSSMIGGSIGITDADVGIISNTEPYLAVHSFKEMLQALNERGNYVVTTIFAHMQLPYLPAGVAMAVARLLQLDFTIRYNLGRMAQLLVYTLCCYFGMKRMHRGKMILAIIALFPTSMLLATDYSYDYWVICFILLGIGYFVGMSQEKEEVSLKDTIIMCAALAIGCLPKQVYAPIVLFPLLISWDKVKNKRKWYYAICILAITFVFASFGIRAVTEAVGAGDVRIDGTDAGGQLQFLLGHFVWYLGMLFKFLLSYVNPITNQMATSWGYLSGGFGQVAFMILLTIALITDKDERDRHAYSFLARIYVVLFTIGELALIATALYMSFTPVGADWIQGCQARYMIPLLFSITILFGGGINLKFIDERVYNTMILGCTFGLIYYNVYVVLIQRAMSL